jgi:hypothetical protein
MAKIDRADDREFRSRTTDNEAVRATSGATLEASPTIPDQE